MLFSGGVLQKTDVMESLAFGATRGLMVIAGLLTYQEALYKMRNIGFYELPLTVVAAAFLVALLGRALEPEPREAKGAALLAAFCLLAVIAISGLDDRANVTALVIWGIVFVLALEQVLVLWFAALGKRRRIIRNLMLSLPVGIEAASIAALGGGWVIIGIVTGCIAAVYFLVGSVENIPSRDTGVFTRRRI